MRRGFTLVELVISIALLGIIVLFLSQSVTGLKGGLVSLKAKEATERYRNDVADLLYRDLLQMEGDWNRTEGKRFDTLAFQTANSLYGYAHPYVTYLVLKNGNRLLRVEGSAPHFPPYPQETAYAYRFLEVAQGIGAFRLFLPKEKEGKGMLLYLKLPGDVPLALEILPPNTGGKL